MSIITLKNQLIHYESLTAGRSGPPIVFVHGAFGSWRNWLPLMQLTDRRCYALSLPGFGDSRRSEAYCLEDFVGVVEGFINALGICECILIGEGAGGLVAQRIAISNKSRVRGIVIFNELSGPLLRSTWLMRIPENVKPELRRCDPKAHAVYKRIKIPMGSMIDELSHHGLNALIITTRGGKPKSNGSVRVAQIRPNPEEPRYFPFTWLAAEKVLRSFLLGDAKIEYAKEWRRRVR
jgi:pimeloyl-ACP methyl ester carboxylesterase